MRPIESADYHHHRAEILLGSRLSCALRYHRRLIIGCCFASSFLTFSLDYLLGYGAVPLLRETLQIERLAWQGALDSRCLPRAPGEQARTLFLRNGTLVCVRFGTNSVPDGWIEGRLQSIIRKGAL